MNGDRLHDELLLLSRAVEWPPTPDLVAVVGQRIAGAGEPRPRGLRERLSPPRAPRWEALRVAVAIVLALVLAAAAVPPARSEMLELLGITKGERIVRVEQIAPPAARRFELGAPTSLPAARRAVDFDVRIPAALGAPSEVRLSQQIPGGMVSLVYDDNAVLSQFRGGAVPYVQKLVGPGTRVQEVNVDGDRGFFISGAPPRVVVEDRDGNARDAGAPVLDGSSVLVWDHGPIAHRLEVRGSLAKALAVARSLR